jgi:signal transduction histidine kinase
MGLHQNIYRWIQLHPRRVDVGVMLGLLVLLALPFLLRGSTLLFVASVAMLVPLAFRRSHTVAALAVLVAIYLLLWAFAVDPVPALISAPLMIQAAAAHGPRWSGFAALCAGAAGALLFSFGHRTINPGSQAAGDWFTRGAVYSVVTVLVVVLAWTFGDLQRTRRLRLQAFEDKSRRMEVERQQERDLAAADERSHIAREMHDIVAHSISVIIAQADGARYASAQDPDVAAATLGTIAETGRSSLREMRRLLGVLRGDEAASTRPLPALADLDGLLDSVRTAGLHVRFASSGTPRRILPPGAELTAYRVVQEALTNVIKHAGPAASAEVELGWTARGLELGVHDDGCGAAADPPTRGAGQGIVGMTERLGLYDGTVTALPRAGGGFSIRAFLPYKEV